MKLVVSAFVAAGLAAAAPATGQPAAATAPATDWTQRVEATSEGGFRMGNPDAPLKLVEFLSLTCPHCANFSAEAMPTLLSDHIRSGRLSLEYRSYVLNHYDLAAAVLSRCASPRNYFGLVTDLLAQQEVWAGRADALTPAQRMEIEVRPTTLTVARTADLVGLKPIAAAHGISAAEAERCLANREGLTQLLAMRDSAERLGVSGTPTFILNGQLLGPSDWSTLRPLLAAPPGAVPAGRGERGR